MNSKSDNLIIESLSSVNDADNSIKTLETYLASTNAPLLIINQVKKIWQSVTIAYAPIRSIHVAGWAAAIHYFICRNYGSPLTQQNICDIYKVSLHNLRNRLSKLKSLNLIHILPQAEVIPESNALIISGQVYYNQEWLFGKQNTLTNINIKSDFDRKSDKVARKKKLRLIPAKSISDKSWLKIMKSCRKIIAEIYEEFETIEIKHFIKHIEVNMALAGYVFKKKDLEYTFGRLHQELNFTAIKGKDPDKFVTLYDQSGRGEPFVFLSIPKK